MNSTTSRSAWLRLTGFLTCLMLFGGLFGCGSDDPAQKSIEVIVPITPGLYRIVSTNTTCPDTSGKIDTLSIDSTGVACSFDVTGFFDASGIVEVSDATVVEEDGHYQIDLEILLRIDPCRVFFRVLLDGDVTDTTVNFQGSTFFDRITSTDSAYDSFCKETYSTQCTTYTTFDAVWIAPDTANVCDN